MTKEMITVNGRTVKAKELDYNFMAELGMRGIAIEDMDKKMTAVLRLYVAFCFDVDDEESGNMITQHIINGGDFTDITDVFSMKAENSDFFQALTKKANKKEVTENNSAKEEKGA